MTRPFEWLRTGFALGALVACGTGAMAQTAPGAGSPPGDKPDAIVCQLLNNCADPATAEASADAERPHQPRVSATRGFSLARPKSPTAAAAAQAMTPPPAPARTGAMATAAPRSRPRAKSPGGQYDLNVAFMTGSAAINPISRDRVSAFATALKDPRLAGRRVRIEGHTDSVGSAVKNQDLSERRAKAIADMLESAGVETSRLDVRGFGASQPLPGTAPRDGSNRRVVAVLAN